MKKLMNLLLTIVLLVSCMGMSVIAEDTQDEGCELPAPTNLRVEGNDLVWDAVEGAAKYEVWINPANYELASYTVSENRLTITNHLFFSGAKTYTFKIHAIGVEEGCNTPYDSPAIISGVRVREMQLNVQVDGATPLIETGNDAEISTEPVSYDEPGAGQEGGGSITKVLVVDEIALKVTVASGYKALIKNSSGETIQTLEESGNVTLNGLDENFEDDTIYVDFEILPVDFVIDFGENHIDLVSKIIDRFQEEEKDYDLSQKGSKLILKRAISNYQTLSVSFYMLHNYFFMMEIQDLMFGQKNSVVDKNERATGICRYENVDSLVAMVKDMEDTKTLASEIDYSCYVIWMRYDADGDKEWTLGNSGDLSFTFKRNIDDKGLNYSDDSLAATASSTYDCAVKIEVDGKELAEEDRVLEEGSLILKLKDSFLNKLSVGEHEVKVTFDNGPDSEPPMVNLTATAKLTVNEAKKQEEKQQTSVTQTPAYSIPVTGVE